MKWAVTGVSRLKEFAILMPVSEHASAHCWFIELLVLVHIAG